MMCIGAGVICTGLVACGGSTSVSYDEQIEKEIARMIADGELIDVAAEEAFDKQISDMFESGELGLDGLFEEGSGQQVEEVVEKEKPVFVESSGPDTLEIDGDIYQKIGANFPPGEYVILPEGETGNSYFNVIKDDETRTVVAFGGNETIDIFDTLDGQYITISSGKVYPIDSAPLPTPNEKGGYKAGMYKAGVQIPAGEYVVRGDSPTAYTYRDLMNEYESDLGFVSAQRDVIMQVDEGHYIEAVWGELYPIALTEDLKPADGVYRDGMYKVGFHIPAGTYKLKADATTAYAQIYKDSYNASREEDFVQAEPEGTFTLKEGQYVIITGGEAVAQ